MAIPSWMATSLTEQRMAALELRHRKALAALTAARESYASVCDAPRIDELEMRRALARVQHLQGQIADLQVAMELLEDGVTA
jgi:uncharacterized coiled-coil protein SlyX